MFGKRKYTYLDHAATTPMSPEIAKRMSEVNLNAYANAGGIHVMAREAKDLVEDARLRTARQLAVQPTDIIFTRGGTESNIMALWGVIAAYRADYPGSIPHIIISAIEHAAIRESVWAWYQEGIVIVDEISVDKDGVIEISELKNMITPETILISIMYANNETGIIQPIREVAKTIRHYRKHHESIYPYFHTDAVQAVNYLDMHIPRLGVDMLSLTSSKMYGPKGIGCLYIHPRMTVMPLMHGGSQEFDMRPGTQDTAGYVGFADALDQARAIWEIETERLTELKEKTLELLNDTQIKYRIHGDPVQSIPCTLNIGIPDVSGERLVIELDARGFAVSSRAACSTNAEGESHILTSMGYTDGWGSIRVSMGRDTVEKDMKRFVEALEDIVEKINIEQKILHTQSS